MSDDDWEWDEPVNLMMGSASGAGGLLDEPDSDQWLYVPDLSSWTGWSAHRVRKEAPKARVRRAGFRMTRRKR